MKKIAIIFGLLVSIFFSNAQTANCTSGDCQNGYGTKVWPSGNSYTGEFKNGLKEGKGTFTWADGDVYKGNYKNNLCEGKGTIIWSDGSSYEGDWGANKINGYGIYKFTDGHIQIGQFVDGAFEGEGKALHSNGYYMQGTFKNNAAVSVKYFDDKNHEISKEVYDNVLKKDNEQTALLKKSKLQIQNIIIPAPNGVSSMTNRAKFVKIQFGNRTDKLLYLWGEDITFYTVNDAKMIGHSNYKTLTEKEIGREILADFNRNSYQDYAFYFPQRNDKGDGYCNEKFQIKINKGKPLGINSDSTYVVTLHDYQKSTDIETLQNLSFWKNSEERKAFFKKEKEDYYNSLKEQGLSKDAIESAKEYYEKRSKKRILTDVHASYDANKNIAHVVFTFKHAISYNSHNVMFDIDFKNKTYKKIAESDYVAKVNDDFYSFQSLRYQDKTTKDWHNNHRIINFDDNSTIDIDKAYLNKISNLTNPPRNVRFETANKEYLVFKSSEDGVVAESYYFVNKKSNFCEKIVTLNSHQRLDVVWNNDFSLAAFNQRYKLNPSDENEVSSVSIINLDNLSVQLLDDHQYQTDVINAQIEQNKANAAKLSAFEMKNAAITRENAEIQAQNDKAKAERRAKCTCCHGTGVVEKQGMYLGNKEITTMTVNGLQQKTTSTVSTYGPSTYAECSCCR